MRNGTASGAFHPTPIQKVVLDLIRTHIEATGMAPNYDEIAEACGFKSRSTVHRIMGHLEERGLIERSPRRARGVRLTSTRPSAGQPAGWNTGPHPVQNLKSALAAALQVVPDIEGEISFLAELASTLRADYGDPYEGDDGRPLFSNPPEPIGDGASSQTTYQHIRRLEALVARLRGTP